MKHALILAILWLTLFTVFVPTTYSYDRQEYIRSYTGIWSDAPQELIDKMVEEYGSLPPTAFERGTKEWWNAYCNHATEPMKCEY